MKILSTLRCWLRAILYRSRTSDEVTEEFQFLLDAYAQDLIQGGMSPEEAMRKARIELGQPELQSERYREAVGLRIFDEVGADVRYGLRSLIRNKGVSAIAVLSLALGIGATTAMFSLIYAVLMHPFPYANSDRIMNPAVINEERPQQPTWFATIAPQFQVLRRAKSIENLLGFTSMNTELTGGNLPEDVATIYLTENADSFFGVPALLGRGIQASDAETHQPVVVLNYRFWQRHFLGDRSVIGQTLQLDHANYTIVGVMPRTFTFNDTISIGDVYLPQNLLHNTLNHPVTWPITPWIKLKAGVSQAAANAEIEAMVRQFAKEFPQRYPRKFHVQLQPISAPFRQNTGTMLALLLAGVVLLLAIGCADCSILMLARGTSRQRELALRQAIGASRWRIIRQLLVESLVIACAGAILGIAASYWLAKLPLQLAPQFFPPEAVIHLNLPILGLSLILGIGAGVLFSLFPAFKLSGRHLSRAMQSGLRQVGGNPQRGKVNIFISGQVALTLLLLTGAGTAAGAFLRLSRLPLGYDPNHVMQAGIMTHWRDPKVWASIQAWPDRVAYIDQIRDTIASVPGVTSVAIGTLSTPPDSGVEQKFELLGTIGNDDFEARIHRISPEYFSTLGIPLLAGRVWNQAENKHGDGIAIVNETFAQHYLSKDNPFTRQVRMPNLKSFAPLVAASPHSDGWRQIIGIVGDARNDGIGRPTAPAIYVPYTTMLEPFVQLEIRTVGEPLSFLPTIGKAVGAMSSDQQISKGAYSLNEAIAHDPQWSRQHLFSILFGCLSAIALILALAGLFSVVAYSVAQKTAEFGIRMALGAHKGHILWVATGNAIISAFVGVLVAIIIDFFLSGSLGRWMESGSPLFIDLLAVTLLLMICALAACFLPALRATSINPTEALRCE
jgi:predicted permease